MQAATEAETQRVKAEADVQTLRAREQAAQAYSDHPALLRLQELKALQTLAQAANARIYVNFDGTARKNGTDE